MLNKAFFICLPYLTKKIKKSFVQLALNPFLHGTSKAQISGNQYITWGIFKKLVKSYFCLFGKPFWILETFDWLTQMSSQSEAFNILKSLPKRKKIWFNEFFENTSPLVPNFYSVIIWREKLIWGLGIFLECNKWKKYLCNQIFK